MNSGRVDDDAFQRIFVHETTLARDTVTMRGLLLALLLGAGSAYTLLMVVFQSIWIRSHWLSMWS